MQDQIAVNLALTTDPVLADIFLRGGQDQSALSPSEQVQFASYWTGTLSAYENMYFQVAEGSYDVDRAAGWWQLLRNMLGLPGVRSHWESRQYLFSPEFTEYVNQEVLSLEVTSDYELGGVIPQ